MHSTKVFPTIKQTKAEKLTMMDDIRGVPVPSIKATIDNGDDPVIKATIDNDDNPVIKATIDNDHNPTIPVATAILSGSSAKRYDSKNELHIPPSFGSHTEELRQQQINLLKDQGFTTGLAHALYDAKKTFPLRIWVVDNSGSMQRTDGNRFVETKKSVGIMTSVPCTRWAELQDCVKQHVDLAGLAQAPTSFRLLNDPVGTAAAGCQYFDVASAYANVDTQVQEAKKIMSSAVPRGVTPLTKHIYDIREAVVERKQELLSRNQRISIILATDGLPTDNLGHGGKQQQSEFIDALRSLEGLPIWIVIRLCTDEEEVVEFYSELLDYQLELSMDVLDDFMSECKEIKRKNPWLNYGLPLHRLREMGFHDRLFDMIDERRLTHQEMHEFCRFLFGQEHTSTLPDPVVDWDEFKTQLERLNNSESTQWNPIKYKVLPWINMKKLEKMYGDTSTTGGPLSSMCKALFCH